MKGGGGLQYRITDNVSLFTEISYRYGNEGSRSSVAVYNWVYGGGIRVRF